MPISIMQLATWITISIVFVIVIGLLIRYIDDKHDTHREEGY